MNTFKLCTVLAFLGAGLAGCSSTPLAPEVAQPAATATPALPAAQATNSAPASSSTIATVTVPAYLDPRNPVSKERSVYFDFDEFAIKSEYAGLIRLQGNYLVSKPALAIKIEANSDERGSPEYNLALGPRRAEAVLKALEIYGVKAAQLEAVSWGEERPRATGHDEAAWAENRRADLVYPQK
jgi:peptidoglycan-associated lipoprotein